MAVTPNSIVTPQGIATSTNVATTANTSYTAPVNTVVVATAGPNGARLTKLRCLPNVTPTATEIQEFRDGDGTGTNKRYSNAGSMLAQTKGQTVAPSIVDFGYSDANPKLLAPNEKVYGAVGVSFSVTFEAEWMNL